MMDIFSNLMTDTLSIANNLSNAGVGRQQAEAIAKSIVDAVERQQGDLATKDFVHGELSSLETRLVYWIVGTGLVIVGVFVAAGVLP